MSNPSNSIFTLQVLRRKNQDIKQYAEYSLKYVLEVDQKGIDVEIEKIKSRFHIDHCWILKNGTRLGIVKIIRNNFYQLGLPPGLENKEIDQIFEVIEKEIASFNVYRMEGTLHSKYVSTVLNRNYKISYSRKKMELNLDLVVNTAGFQDLVMKPFAKNDLRELGDVFSDAYSGSVDERIGMFDRSIAHSAIRSIMDGEFGDFAPELSGLLYDKDGKHMIGGILITLLENYPIVMIIGVQRGHQQMGMGRKLMSWTIDKVKQNNYNKLRLWVTIENTIASSLYESLGFKEILSTSTVVKLF